MMSRTMRYSGLTTKVRAMYGKRLRAADFRRMAAMTSVSEILDYLRQNPSWSPAISTVDSEHPDRASLETALRNQVREEYVRLNNFTPQQDKTLLAFPVMLAELEAIMITLRRLISVRVKDPNPLPSRFILHGKLDYAGLAASKSFDELADAARNTVYYSALLRLRPEQLGDLPDYTLTESLLRATYFTFIYRLIHKKYSGETRSILLRCFGEQVDLLNIVHILRLKRFFSDDDRYVSILFPFHYKLRPAMVKALCTAPDVDSVLTLLEQTPYAKQFRGVASDAMDDYYRRSFYQFNRRQLFLSLPSIYSAVAYLNLKELELDALINVIESVNYGVPFDTAYLDLIGD